jgi:hypothetical protein
VKLLPQAFVAKVTADFIAYHFCHSKTSRVWQKLAKKGLCGTKVLGSVSKVLFIILDIYSSIAPKPQKMKIIFAGEFRCAMVFIARVVKNSLANLKMIFKICGFGVLERFRQSF